MKQLIRKFKDNLKDMDKILLVTVIIMVLYGLFNILTASSRESVVKYDNSIYFYFKQHGIMLSISLIGSLIIINFPTKYYRLLAPFGLFIILALLFYTAFWGEIIRGSRNWIKIFGFQFQPSEFAKPILLVSIAIFFEMFNKVFKSTDLKKKYGIIFGVIWGIALAMAIFISLQKDFGTMVIIMFIFGIMYISSPISITDKVRSMITMFIIGVLGIGVIYLNTGKIFSHEQLERLNEFHQPCQNYESGGYQICNGFIALNDGGLMGLGIGDSKQKYSYIPDPHTDSVFAIIGEELGLLKSSLIFIGYIIILYRILKIASKSNTLRGRYICIGVATYLFIHVFINLGGVLAVIPFTGVPLPFFSYGGTFTISLLCSIAIVERVSIENKNKKIKVKV
ncbi:MAG: FtsW/RodA/SpoVE family cell cycle protein [Bacilli bacterium]|nr:FtsW/RodA/SpoVE family cell cycle protein [Bacilli bacterium]MDD4808430.1 FtsW/RodA/SpoVE family cell cycle protein [Bacilli bacterium]